MKISAWIRSVVSVIFTDRCAVCGRTLIDGEQLLCLHCNVAMPRTRYHLSSFNHLHERLVGNARVEKAAAWFYYKRESPYTNLILQAKYFDRPEIAHEAARIYAREILSDKFFDGIDMLLPIPMHSFKELKRGYNQAEMIARGVSKVTGIPIGDNIVAKSGHKTQTRRGAYDRYVNVADLFDVENANELAGKHLLVIDDVVTTGSTLLSACETLRRSVPDSVISVLALGSATLD